jgi:hypothetical protein
MTPLAMNEASGTLTLSGIKKKMIVLKYVKKKIPPVCFTMLSYTAYMLGV